ncbi:hypothetical protein ACN5L1_004100 [Cronobacter turicensis]
MAVVLLFMSISRSVVISVCYHYSIYPFVNQPKLRSCFKKAGRLHYPKGQGNTSFLSVHQKAHRHNSALLPVVMAVPCLFSLDDECLVQRNAACSFYRITIKVF